MTLDTAASRAGDARTGQDPDAAALRPAAGRSWGLAVALVVLAAALAAPFAAGSFLVFQLTMMLVYAIAILGLNILTGINGQFSLGHGAFYAVGAYTAAIMMDHFGIGYLWTLPAAGVVCFLAGFLFGWPALRLEGVYLALATFALAVVTPQLFKLSPFEPWTNGVMGIVIDKPGPPFGLPLSADQWLYLLTLGVALGAWLCARNLVASRGGRALMAIRDNPIAARSMGVNTALYKSLALGVSALYTGVAGALGAIVVQFVAPDSFTFALSIAFFVGLVVGGVGWLPGALLGGAFVMFVPNIAESLSKGLSGAAYGAILILLIYVMPTGLGGLLHAAGRRLSGRKHRVHEDPARVSETGGEAMTKRRSILKGVAGAGLLLGVGLVLPGAACAAGMYDPGASDSEIKIGNINPYSGPASAYSSIAKTIAAYFDKVNAEGGINGRKITFVSYDDGYSPPKAVEQARKLVESDQVLLIFQSLGTPSNSAIEKYMNIKKVPQLFVATGATKFGDPEKFPWTMGWQPNYQSEGIIYGRWILANVPDAKIGVLYQNDDFGKDGLSGLKQGLGDKASMIVAEAPYEVSEPTVDSQIVRLKASGANVFVNIATPKFAAQAIKKVKEIGWDATEILTNVSNSVGAVLKPAGLDNAKGIVSTAYLKDMQDPQWADDQGRRDWLAFMDKYYPAGDKTSTFTAYGYTVAQAMVHVLKQCGDDLTRANVMKQAASMKDVPLPLLLPGITMTTSATDYFPLQKMQMMKFNGERWVNFGDVISGAVGE
ncbi:ABC-type branched-chain amino acid transport system, permease component [Tistlia consotensis]|uniref:ABC-type branched-chain amino acid transport system, permease component n=1 Tax=Tistlia consotensis USBA 355 TaxID=560819 RepID=A0A1Y6BHR5_9PROT|nr:ABC transporter substrate-binding protein [Tistlia consotensis]SMF04161.1 ABC-type branched-chain amino acid transport system, permease component [Tistlia consotensis USBA 355]SNR54286.1 ABC-type branched-chain amino acid transport system, permease component [Tistlia consotensis]